MFPNHLRKSVGCVVAHLRIRKSVESGWRFFSLDKDDYYWVLVVSLEQRISARGEEDGDKVVLENQYGR